MSVKLRLQRKGRTKAPFYHIVAADSRSPRDGKFIEKIGTYNPLTVPATIDLDRVRAFYWVDNGAQPTDTVNAILRFKGVLYQKHLMRGVRKGAMTLEQAEALLAKWVDNKEGNVEARKIETIRKKEAHIKLVDGKPKARPVKVVEAPVVEETHVEEVVETSVAVEAIAPVAETIAVVEAPIVETVVETAHVVETPVVVETVAVVETPVVETVVETVAVVETPVVVEAAPVAVETVTVTETVVEPEPIVVAEKVIEAAAPTATVVSTPAAVTTTTTTSSTVKTGVTLGSSTIVTTSKVVDVDDNQFATKTEVVGSTIVDVDDNQFKSETDFLRSTTVDVDDSEYASKTEVVATTTTVLEIVPEDDTTKEA
jgi:small subunit ribosomal protein S16